MFREKAGMRVGAVLCIHLHYHVSDSGSASQHIHPEDLGTSIADVKLPPSNIPTREVSRRESGVSSDSEETSPHTYLHRGRSIRAHEHVPPCSESPKSVTLIILHVEATGNPSVHPQSDGLTPLLQYVKQRYTC